MNNSALKLLTLSLCAAGLFSSSLVMAEVTSAKPTKSDVPLIDLGAELGISQPKMGSNHSDPKKGTQGTGQQSEPIKHSPAVRFETKSKPKTLEPTHNIQPSGQAVKSTANKKAPIHAPHWSYSGDTGPKYWGELSEEYSTCKSGKNQSPIDLRDKAGVGTTGLSSLDIYYQDVPLKVINNGHTVQVNYPLGSYIQVGGHRYELMQFHFHTPSEHKKEGFNYPMEVHIVHKDGDGNLAVVGVIFQEGEENEYLNKLLPYLPKQKGKQFIHRGESLNPVFFIPGNQEFYKYSGSLTTPPCTEGVYWMVFKHPIEASMEQLQIMNEFMGENSRPVQKGHARTLLKSWPEQLEEERMYEFY